MGESIAPPPKEVWFVVYRWTNQQAVGRNEGFYSERQQMEDFLHHCYVSQFTPGDVLSPLGVWELVGAEWRAYDYTVSSLLQPYTGADDDNTTTNMRRCATIPEHPTGAPPAGEVDPAILGAIPPAAYLPPPPPPQGAPEQ